MEVRALENITTDNENVAVVNSTNSTSDLSWQYTARCQIGQAVCPLGILSSILTVCSLSQKLWTERNVFFILMAVIAVFDLFFNCGFLFVRCSPLTYPRAVLKGLIFSCSLASDLCALALTTERCLLLSWPQQMSSVSSRIAIGVRTIAGVIIGIISLFRMQHMVVDMDKIGLLSSDTREFWKPIHVGVSIFGDIILPFLLIILMAGFSGKIIRVVVKGRRNRAKVHAPARAGAAGQPLALPDASRAATTKQTKVDDLNSVISLILVLDFFFFLNQLGYCFFAVAEVINTVCHECQLGDKLYKTATFQSDFVECLSRSLTFYFYVAFSQLLRQEFLTFVARIRNRLCL